MSSMTAESAVATERGSRKKGPAPLENWAIGAPEQVDNPRPEDRKRWAEAYNGLWVVNTGDFNGTGDYFSSEDWTRKEERLDFCRTWNKASKNGDLEELDSVLRRETEKVNKIYEEVREEATEAWEFEYESLEEVVESFFQRKEWNRIYREGSDRSVGI